MERSEAKALGLVQYNTGLPCKHGHLANRKTVNGTCMVCSAAVIRKCNTNEKRNEYRRKNPGQHRADVARWAKRHPHVVRAVQSRRRARKLLAEGSYTGADIERLFEEQGETCICGASLSLGYHIDHKIPLSRGGSNWPHNLQLLCAPCNLSKGSKTMDEWRPT